MPKRSLVFAFSLVLPLFAGCGDSGGSGGSSGGPCGTATPVMPTAQDVHDRIFQCSCVFSSCHDSGSHKANMVLETVTTACRDLQKMSCEFPTERRTDPSAPDSSIVLKKLGCPGLDCTPGLGTPVSTCQEKDQNGVVLNERMPAGDNPPLDQGRISTLRAWISMGLPGCTPAVDAGVDAPQSDAD